RPRRLPAASTLRPPSWDATCSTGPPVARVVTFLRPIPMCWLVLRRRFFPTAVGTETLYAMRSATKMYRTTPLRALWQHPPYFHDGSAATLADVVNHYVQFFNLTLTPEQKTNLVEFLKSL